MTCSNSLKPLSVYSCAVKTQDLGQTISSKVRQTQPVVCNITVSIRNHSHFELPLHMCFHLICMSFTVSYEYMRVLRSYKQLLISMFIKYSYFVTFFLFSRFRDRHCGRQSRQSTAHYLQHICHTPRCHQGSQGRHTTPV